MGRVLDHGFPSGQRRDIILMWRWQIRISFGKRLKIKYKDMRRQIRGVVPRIKRKKYSSTSQPIGNLDCTQLDGQQAVAFPKLKQFVEVLF